MLLLKHEELPHPILPIQPLPTPSIHSSMSGQFKHSWSLQGTTQLQRARRHSRSPPLRHWSRSVHWSLVWTRSKPVELFWMGTLLVLTRVELMNASRYLQMNANEACARRSEHCWHILGSNLQNKMLGVQNLLGNSNIELFQDVPPLCEASQS